MLGPPTCSGASIGETARTDGSGVFSVFRRYFLFGSAGGHLVQTGSLAVAASLARYRPLMEGISQHGCSAAPGSGGGCQSRAEIVGDYPALRSLILSHEQLFLSEVQQSAACNAVHTVQERVCRWILRLNDLVGMNVAVTQELLAGMIGVRRTSVTAAATSLQAEGIIKYRRGHIQIVDTVASFRLEDHQFARTHARCRLPP
jgi:CRP-like cAMP-binding protein